MLFELTTITYYIAKLQISTQNTNNGRMISDTVTAATLLWLDNPFRIAEGLIRLNTQFSLLPMDMQDLNEGAFNHAQLFCLSLPPSHY